ncbi:MAG: hypothetical protein ACI4MH_04965 [Candidatus Coproplasma sp.]
MVKQYDYSVKSDFKSVYCNVENCKVVIRPNRATSVHAIFAYGVKLDYAYNSEDFVISQKSRLREKLFGKTPQITVTVPEHLVLNIHISGKRAEVLIDGGIYSEVDFSFDCGSVKLAGIAAERITSRGNAIAFNACDCTVKDKLLANIEAGDFTIENSFASHINCHLNCGNAGAVNLNCRDSIFELAAGNVNATVLGDEDTFDVIVNAKAGTCNKESKNIEGELGVFKAYTDCGNIHVEFIKPEDYSPEEETK